VIVSFACKETESFADGCFVKAFESFQKVATRKIAMVNAAHILSDLKSPPGNRLEPLKGDRKGQHSIRINDAWRVCFVWTDAGPERVEIVQYHKG